MIDTPSEAVTRSWITEPKSVPMPSADAARTGMSQFLDAAFVAVTQ